MRAETTNMYLITLCYIIIMSSLRLGENSVLRVMFLYPPLKKLGGYQYLKGFCIVGFSLSKCQDPGSNVIENWALHASGANLV